MANTLTQVFLGRYKTGAENDFGIVGTDTIRASVYDAAAVDCWVVKFGGRVGKYTATAPTARYVLHKSNSGTQPDGLLGYGPQFTPNTSMQDASGGAVYRTDVNSNNGTGPSNSAIPVAAGVIVALSAHAKGAQLGHGMVAAADISKPNEQFFERSWGTNAPPDPFGGASIGVQGWMQLWAEGWQNVAPEAPANVAPSGDITSLTPTITGEFRDKNGNYGSDSGLGVDTGDWMTGAQVQVRRKSDAVSFWDNTYAVTTGERDAEVSSVVYAGTTLVRGTVYQVRVRHKDFFGTWGAWSDWQDFTPSAQGTVTLAGTPTGKTNSLTPAFAFSWTHQTGLSTNAAIVRLYKDGVLVATSGTIAITVANNASGSIPWASTGFATLEPGRNHSYDVQARDTGNVWSAFSGKRAFSTDAAPGIPTSLSPANNVVLSSSARPVLTCVAADADDVAAAMTVKARIKNNAGAVLQTRVMTYVAGSSPPQWTYTTVAGDFNTVGTYKWDAYSYDGFLYSGGQTVEANATKSPEAVFQWLAVPSVTITAPTSGSTITTDRPVVTWTVSAQTKYQVDFYVAGTGTLIFSTGLVTDSVARSYQIPSGYLHNGNAIDIKVTVENASLQGSAVASNVTLTYATPASPARLTATAVAIGDDPIPSAVQLDWDDYSGTAFASYVVERSDLAVPLVKILSAGQSSYVDYHAPVGVEVEYRVRVTELRGTDEVSSAASVVTVKVDLRGMALVSAANPAALRFVVRGWKARAFAVQGEEAEYLTWGGDAPTAVASPQSWLEGSVSVLLAEDEGDPAELKAALEAIGRDGGVISYRDRFTREWMRIPRGGLKFDQGRSGRVTAEIALRGVDYAEGVTS